MKITVGKRYEVVGQDIYGAGKSHIVEVIARSGDEITVKTDNGLVGNGVVDEDEDAEVTLTNKNHYSFTGTFGVEHIM
jgi:hypothetical protein